MTARYQVFCNNVVNFKKMDYTGNNNGRPVYDVQSVRSKQIWKSRLEGLIRTNHVFRGSGTKF